MSESDFGAHESAFYHGGQPLVPRLLRVRPSLLQHLDSEIVQCEVSVQGMGEL